MGSLIQYRKTGECVWIIIKELARNKPLDVIP